MLNYHHNHNTMLLPLSASSSSDALLHEHANNNKFPGTQIFLRQQHTVQIIQLVECDPPPPRRISSVIESESCAYSSEYSESSPSDEDDGGDDEEGGEEEEEAGSSYCSSDVPEPVSSPPQQQHQHQQQQWAASSGGSPPPRPDPYAETHAIRMKRILAWRENFSTHLTDTLSGAEPALSSSLKRKMDLEDDDDTMSHTSKRSRSQASQADARVHACPACDAFFATRRGLLRHGRDARANEACAVAVEYAFE